MDKVFWTPKTPVPKGFYLSTDLLYKTPYSEKYEWLKKGGGYMGAAIEGEHFYWNGEERTWRGAVEKAIAYPTMEEAEGQAVFAVALDPETAGHVHVIEAAAAWKREAQNIERRKVDEAKFKQHQENRFKLRRDDGGSV
jgi:hypothetical protein